MIDCAIVGGGPAGLSAGLYATRGGLKSVTLFELGMPGGQITQSSEVENYPGIFNEEPPVTGMELMQKWQKQCFHFGLKHEMAKVVRVKKEREHFLIELENGTYVESKSAIVCTGSTPKRAGFKGEDEFMGRGVSTCATCDGFFYKDKPVSVLGGGDTALEEAIYLSNICSDVYVIHRRDTFRAAPITVQRAQGRSNIHFVFDAAVKEVLGDQRGVTAVVIEDKNTKNTKTLDTPGIFVFVGHNVNNEVLKDDNGDFICDVDKSGNVVVDLNMNSSLKGLFVAGDLRINAPKQVVCAAGDGAIAALQVISYLQELD